MSSAVLSGIMTGILIVLFVGVWVWAWSERRKSSFDAAARIPLDDNDRSEPRR
jgi:cytochrome c oxidase cbb3-type subunit 4